MVTLIAGTKISYVYFHEVCIHTVTICFFTLLNQWHELLLKNDHRDRQFLSILI